MINKERMRLGIVALRSGDYAQGYGYLRQTRPKSPSPRPPSVAHCCLGVLTEVAIAKDPNIRFHFSCDRHGEGWGEESVLRGEVARWYGLDSTDPELPLPRGGSAPATELNDSSKWSFDQIADAFEKLVEGDDNG